MRKILKLAVVILFAIGLSACASRDLSPIVKTADVPIVNVPAPQPVQLPRPELQVMNSDGVLQLADKLKKSPDPNFVIYTMDYPTFEKFMDALSKVADYIDAKQGEVDYYKNNLNSLNKKQ